MTGTHRAGGLALLLALGVAGQGSAAPTAAAQRLAAPAAPGVTAAAYADLRWRLLGPLRGGWSTCAAGVPGRPDLFYFGAADGGVWKTTDAGRTWMPIFDGQAVGSVGGLAVASSNPDVLYVGTGQVDMRYDVMEGDGVYRSADGGATWTHAGLTDSRHIGRILVDPRDANVVLVAALGHLYGASPERGVFRSEDGGRTWRKVLFLDADTGAVDLAADPARPDVVFAALWQVRRHPWLDYHTPAIGPGSGIYRSADGGRTWSRLASPVLPAGAAGRIALAVAPGSGGARVYATIDAGRAEGPEGDAESGKLSGLYRSDDSGATWRHVNDDAALANSYFSRITVDPRSPDTLYVMGRSVRRSTDGGATFSVTRGAPGGDDFHFMWIDPAEPRRMILASDQGTIVSVNGGATWSSWYNQPTGQFYHLAADDRFPYWVYSSQQDSGTVAIASRSDYGQLTFRDWHPVGGEERDFCLPDPEDPLTVFVSGLGGRLDRCDGRTGRVENVSPWPVSSYARRPTTVRYRYGWITPLAFSPVAPHALYQGAQVLFRSTDRGGRWETISPDLTGAQPGPPAADGAGSDAGQRDCEGDLPIGRARACGYGVISAIAPSPRERDAIWVGTDDGLVQLTRDGGRTWQDVTPSGLSEWSKVSIIEASPVDPDTAYAAVDRHRLDDPAPHIYRTHDSGRTWTAIDAGLPAGSYALTVRQDPVEPRLLFAGTRRGVSVSFDDGDHWRSLQQNLPATAINDLLVHGNDLVAATQGRGLWVLDDLSPLRQMGRRAPGDAPYLFPPATAFRVRPNQNRDTPLPPEEPTAPNPPAGIALDYDLGPSPAGPVVLEILDTTGATVRRLASDAAPASLETEERYFAEEWLKPPAAPPAGPGAHRIFWDLRGERPKAAEYEYSIAATPSGGTPLLPQGALVPPGRYEVRLTAGGVTRRQPLVVRIDPRAQVAAPDLEAQRALYQDVAGQLERAVAASREIDALADRLRRLTRSPQPGTGTVDARQPAGGERPAAGGEPPATDAGRAAREAAARLASDLARFRGGRSDDNIAAIGRALTGLAIDLEAADGPPTRPQQEVLTDYARRLDAALRHWQAIRSDRLPKLDALLAAAGLAAIGPGS